MPSRLQIVNSNLVLNFLDGHEFPASKQSLISYAKNYGADAHVIHTLKTIPGETFETPQHVEKAINSIQ